MLRKTPKMELPRVSARVMEHFLDTKYSKDKSYNGNRISEDGKAPGEKTAYAQNHGGNGHALFFGRRCGRIIVVVVIVIIIVI